jgi:hypothetical protein
MRAPVMNNPQPSFMGKAMNPTPAKPELIKPRGA